jgi:NAD(P)-dependent dehydrogenase (short-subunit alcohol dehydrogenase family)
MQNHAELAQLKDRVILVTGAARGIGAAVSKALAAAGATVILLDKQLKSLEQVYDEIDSAYASSAALYPLDLKGATQPDYQQLAQTIQSEFGRLDGLVHCAAALGQLAPIEHQDIKTWLETFHINMTAAWLLTQACLPLLKQHDNSQIIFSTDEHKGRAYWGAYGIAKAAIDAFASQLADEFEAEGRITVHCLDPGAVQTELYARAYPAADPSSLPLPEIVAPLYVDCFS